MLRDSMTYVNKYMQKQNQKQWKNVSAMPNLHINCFIKSEFQNVDQHTGDQVFNPPHQLMHYTQTKAWIFSN